MKTNRFVALLITGLMTMSIFAGCGTTQESTKEAKKVVIGLAIRGLDNPYYVQLVQGAEMFIKTLPAGTATLQVMESNGSDEKQINDIKALIARGGKDTIIYVDPNQAPNVASIAEICEDAGVYFTTCWSMADGILPEDYKYYVSHQTTDNVQSGYDIAVAMFKNFKTPNSGKILAVQGMLANNAAIDRFKGLQKALKEFPNVKLLDNQDAEWNPQKALNITQTWLSKYNDVDGIWSANDQMALAVVQALKAKGLDKKVVVAGIDAIPDAISAIKNGDMVATVGSNPWGQVGYALAASYDAYTGKLDTTKMDPGQRMFYTKGIPITKETVADYESKYVKNEVKLDYTKYLDFIDHPMVIEKK